VSEQDQRLARAWLALAGWRVGMVDLIGQAFDSGGHEPDWVTDAGNSDSCLPDIDSPANWGHWLAWTAETFGDVSLHRRDGVWSAETAEITSLHGTPAAVLMELYCNYCNYFEDDAHEAAREWWKHEMEESDG
jgi:hypothetical protein